MYKHPREKRKVTARGRHAGSCQSGLCSWCILGEGGKEKYPPHELVSPVPQVQAVVIEADSSSVNGGHICVTQQRPWSCPTFRKLSVFFPPSFFAKVHYCEKNVSQKVRPMHLLHLLQPLATHHERTFS